VLGSSDSARVATESAGVGYVGSTLPSASTLLTTTQPSHFVTCSRAQGLDEGVRAGVKVLVEVTIVLGLLHEVRMMLLQLAGGDLDFLFRPRKTRRHRPILNR